MADSNKVTAGKPKTAGAISVAPLGTELPTSALPDLAAAFKSLGYVSDDGLTNSTGKEVETVKAWGGATVQEIETSQEDTFSYALIEALNVDVLKNVYGEDNVTVDSITGEVAITVNAKPKKACSYVVDIILNDDMLKRIVIPNAKIIELDDIVYKDNEVISYNLKLSALLDAAENSHYEYIIKKA